jgi:hypothetical protein
MKTIYSNKDWQKVRQLARKWYGKTGWFIPSWLYIVGAVVGLLASFIGNSNNKMLWFCLVAICGAGLYAREKQIEGFVDGWSESQEYHDGDLTIDELLDWEKPKKNQTN